MEQTTDLIIDLCICASAAFTFTYPISMPGPLNWWIKGSGLLLSTASPVIWELGGVVFTGILE